MPTTPTPIDDINALVEHIQNDPTLATMQSRVAEHLDDDPGHDMQHALRVALWTQRLTADHVPVRLAVVAALFHDIVNLPKNSPDRAQASSRSAEVARAAMAEAKFAQADIDLVVDAIRDHSFSRGATPSSLLGKALQDADRLEALGALGLFRTVSCGSRMGAVYFHPDDPFGRRGRSLDDRRYTVDHFFEKLLALPETMQTKTGRQEAHKRVAFMKAFLTQLGEELGESF